MKFLQYLFYGFILLCSSVNSSAQEKKDKPKTIIPMYEFLKANMDSTIVYQSTSNWDNIPQYFMLSKKGDTLTAYKYQALPLYYKKKILLPKVMASKLLRVQVIDMSNLPVDINAYFNPIYIPQDSIKQFWNNLTILNPWQMKDDATDGYACPIPATGSYSTIFDGGHVKLSLITKNEIKELSFYAPDFYEKECPGRTGRININKIEKYFSVYFQHMGM